MKPNSSKVLVCSLGFAIALPNLQSFVNVRHNSLFSLTAWAKINSSPAEGIFEDFGVAEVTEAILATEDPVAVLTAGLTALFELFDDR